MNLSMSGFSPAAVEEWLTQAESYQQLDKRAKSGFKLQYVASYINPTD